MDMKEPYWRISWLMFSMGAVGLSIVCAVSLWWRSKPSKWAGVAAAVVAACYWLYLYTISPPEEINAYLLGGMAVIALSVVTISSLLAHSLHLDHESTS